MTIDPIIVVCVLGVGLAPFVLLFFIGLLTLAQEVVERFCTVMQIAAGVVAWIRTPEGHKWVKNHWTTRALVRRQR